MTELEEWKLQEKYDREQFHSWWENEGEEILDNSGYDEYPFNLVYEMCQIAWLNGAYKARNT